MRVTVPTAVPTREVPTVLGKVVAWANKEVMPVLRQMRDALNLEGAQGTEITTAGTGTFLLLWKSDPMPTGATWMLEARVVGRSTAGPVQSVAYVLRALFQNDGGTVTQVGTTFTTYLEESDAGYDIKLEVDGQTVVLRVQDDGVSATRYNAKILTLHQPVG